MHATSPMPSSCRQNTGLDIAGKKIAQCSPHTPQSHDPKNGVKTYGGRKQNFRHRYPMLPTRFITKKTAHRFFPSQLVGSTFPHRATFWSISTLLPRARRSIYSGESEAERGINTALPVTTVSLDMLYQKREGLACVAAEMTDKN